MGCSNLATTINQSCLPTDKVKCGVRSGWHLMSVELLAFTLILRLCRRLFVDYHLIDVIGNGRSEEWKGLELTWRLMIVSLASALTHRESSELYLDGQLIVARGNGSPVWHTSE